MGEKRRILVVDDEKDLCALIKDILEETGQFDVDITYDGAEGYKRCSEVKMDLILLDFVMPEMKGDEFLRIFKKNPEMKNIPVVIMSGLGEAVYFDKEDWRKWRPGNSAVEKRGEISEIIVKGEISSGLAKDLGIASYLSKPFSKNSF